MTWLPRSPGSSLVLRLNQETIHRLHLAVLATMRPALDPPATWSLKPSLFVFPTLGGLISNDLSRLFFTCSNTSQDVAYTSNT
jgi:hypothetical protein